MYEKLWTLLLALVFTVGLILPAVVTEVNAAENGGACISNAHGQDGAPNKPLSEGASFTLGSGDKIMLWCDMIDLVPICEALTVKYKITVTTKI